jgi:hypothetical protein
MDNDELSAMWKFAVSMWALQTEWLIDKVKVNARANVYLPKSTGQDR